MTKGCPECKLYALELIDDYFIWYGKFLKKYKCSECGYEEMEGAQ